MAKVGRPPKFKTPEEMQKVIDAYFQECKDNEEPVTVSGLAYALDMSTHALRNYEQKDEFLPTVKKSKQRAEMAMEKKLVTGHSVAGVIFNLKNNFGWKDKTDHSHEGPDGKPLSFLVIHE